MDDKLFISDLKEGMAIDSCFVVSEKDLLEFKSKPGRYLQVKLKDRTGEVWGKCWEEGLTASELFDVGDVVRIRGNVVFYNGHLQIQFELRGIEKLEEFDIRHFIESSKEDVDELFSQIKGLAASFTNMHLKRLLNSFLLDPAFEEGFKF